MNVKEVIEALQHYDADVEVTVQDKGTEIAVDGMFVRADGNRNAVLEIDALGVDDEGPVLVLGGLKLEAVSDRRRDLHLAGVGSLTDAGNPAVTATVRWRCPTGDGGASTTDISTRGDILTLLDSGWPICPFCGEDMEALDHENDIG